MDTKNEISDQLEIWNKAIQTGDLDKIVACYAIDAILLPTISAKIRRNHDEIRDYFIGFLAKNPKGRILEQNIRIHNDIAINSGLYTFSLKGSVHTNIAARFTFVYRKHEGRWLIIEHHSSILPVEPNR